jgi:hypothetical protein
MALNKARGQFRLSQRKGEVAEWGDATVCNAVHVGSNPTFASIPHLLSVSAGRQSESSDFLRRPVIRRVYSGNRTRDCPIAE